MSTFADVFAAFLERTGTTHVFGFPGGATVELTESCRRRGIDFVLAHSESSAGYMAAMYGDLRGSPGVALSTLGPGASNLVNPAALGLLERTPLLAVTGSAGLSTSRYPHQRIDQVKLFEPVTKWSAQASAGSLGTQLLRAWRVASAERPGSVHLDVPADEVLKDAVDCPDPLEWPVVEATAWDVTPICRRLAAAKRPVILAGNSAARHRVGESLRSLVESFGIPFLTTSKGKGIISELHPWWGGVIDMASPRHVETFLDRADLLLLVGFDTVELIRHWQPKAPVILIDPCVEALPTFTPEVEAHGDLAAILGSITGELRASFAWTSEELGAQRSSYLQTAIARSGEHLAPSTAIDALRTVLPDETIVVSDVGSHKMALGSLWRCTRPRTFFQSNGLGTMGYSLGAGNAAKLLCPETPVAVLTGDGGLAMVASELGTAADRNLAVIVVVFSDGALDRITRKQAAQGYPTESTHFGARDYLHLASAYGAEGYRAGTRAEIKQAVESALASRRPSLVEIPIDTAEYQQQFIS